MNKFRKYVSLNIAAFLALIAALVVPPSLQAQAEIQHFHNSDADIYDDDDDFVLSASFFTRHELRAGFDRLGFSGRRLGESDNTVYRARFGFETKPRKLRNGLEVRILVQPQASGFWGDSSGGLADPGLGMHQASTRISLQKHWLDVGRFEMAYGEHLVIGNVGWHEVGRSFDGIRLHSMLMDTEAYIDGFATIIREGSLVESVTPAFAGDRYFVGAYAGIGPALSPELELDIYALLNIAPETRDGAVTQDFSTAELTMGVRAKKTFQPVTLRSEFGLQVGERAGSQDNVLAFHVDADAMAKLNEGVTLGLGALYASGDDSSTSKNEAWNQLFPTAHKFLGLMDIIGARSNVAAASAKARFKVKALLETTFGVDSHLFFRPETIGGTERYTGFETDSWAKHVLGPGLSLRAQYSFFVPNEVGPLLEDRLAHYVEVQLAYSL